MSVPNPFRLGGDTLPTLAELPRPTDRREGDPRPGMQYGDLIQKNPCYLEEIFAKIDDLYSGGFAVQEKAQEYIPQLPYEPRASYEIRCRLTSYQPFYAQIVDQLATDLFGQPLAVTDAADAKDPETPGKPEDDYYVDFETNADGAGTSFVDMMSGVVRTALNKRCAYVYIDGPEIKGPEPQTRLEEEERGALDFYACELPPEQLIDWELNEDGEFIWAICHTVERKRANPRVRRNLITETFQVWEMGPDGNAIWERFQITYDPKEPPKDETPVPSVAAGGTSFSRIPILRFELDEGLWVGNKVGTLALEHYQRRSSVVLGGYRSLLAVLWAKLAGEVSAPNESISEAQEDPNRGKNARKQFEERGITVLGHQDEIGFAEPEGKAYEVIIKDLDGLRADMFGVTHSMAASIKPTSTAMGRSGLSKQKDEDATAKVLKYLGGLVRTFAVKIYETIARARGDEDIVWAAHGLDDYEADQRSDVLLEGVQLDLIGIPSKTFKKAHKAMVAKKLLTGIDPKTFAIIKTEIDAGVEAEDELREIKLEATKEDIENRPPPGAAVPKAGIPGKPNGKQPAPGQPSKQPNA